MKTIINYPGSNRKIIIATIIIGFMGIILNAQYAFYTKEILPVMEEILPSNTVYETELLHHILLADMNYSEEKMVLEDWMIHPENWLETADKGFHLEYDLNMESELSFEKWMFETEWMTSELPFDNELVYESWMLKPLKWN